MEHLTLNDTFRHSDEAHFKVNKNHYLSVAGISPGYTHLAPTTTETRDILKSIADDPQKFYQLKDRLALVDPHTINEFTTRKNSISKISFHIKSRQDGQDKRIDQATEDLKPLFRPATKLIQESLLMGIKPREIIYGQKGARTIPIGFRPLRKDQFFWINSHLHYSEFPGFKFKARELTEQDLLHLFAPTYFHEEPESDKDYYGGLFKYAVVTSSIKFYVLWQFSRQSGRYGKPIRLGKYPDHATDADIQVLKNAVFDMGEDLGAAIPEGMNLDLLEARNIASNTNMFDTIMHRLDGVVTKLYLGVTLATTAEKYGTRAQSSDQMEVKDDYFEIDLERNEAGLQILLDRWWWLNISRTEPCPLYIENDYKAPEDLVKLSSVVTNLKNAGAGNRIPSRWINEKFDIPEPEEGEETLGNPDPGF